ncbi:hypothetical protein Tco_0867806 [Tanacetum coccineum]
MEVHSHLLLYSLYKGGKVNWVDDIDSDTFSIAEVTSMLQELGYENPCMAYYYKKPNSELENGLVELVVDKDVYEMLIPKKLPIKSKKGQQSSRKEVGQSSRNGSGSENGSGSDSGSDSEDSDYFVDEENLIEDVDVDMAEFKSHTDPDEGVRRKALRKVARMNKAIQGKGERVYKEDFFLGEQFATSKLVKDKVTRVSKKFEVGVSKQKVFRAKKMAYERVVGSYSQQYAQLRDYCMELKEKNPNTTVKIEVEPPEDPDRSCVVSCHGPYPGGPYSNCCLSRPKTMESIIAYAVVEDRSKDSYEVVLDCLVDGVIPAKQSELSNAEHRFCLKQFYNLKLSYERLKDIGSELYKFHWLTTWKEMYKFKINPVNGPQGWKKSDVPTTIIPPKPHPQIGRPPKKRKKSAAELADEMMKLVTIQEACYEKKGVVHNKLVFCWYGDADLWFNNKPGVLGSTNHTEYTQARVSQYCYCTISYLLNINLLVAFQATFHILYGNRLRGLLVTMGFVNYHLIVAARYEEEDDELILIGIVMENSNSPNEPNDDIPKENPVIPKPSDVEDAHDPNEMVDIPDDEELVDYDGDDEEEPEEESKEEPEEEPQEEPEPNNGHGNQFAQHPNP